MPKIPMFFGTHQIEVTQCNIESYCTTLIYHEASENTGYKPDVYQNKTDLED